MQSSRPSASRPAPSRRRISRFLSRSARGVLRRNSGYDLARPQAPLVFRLGIAADGPDDCAALGQRIGDIVRAVQAALDRAKPRFLTLTGSTDTTTKVVVVSSLSSGTERSITAAAVSPDARGS